MSEDLIKRSDAIKAFVEETNEVSVEEAIKVVDAYLRIRECDEVWDSIRAIRDCLECAKYDIAELIQSAEPKTGEWVLDPNGMDWNIPAWRCSECGFVANYIGVEANGLGNNPMNWAGSKFCPQCGARITGYER